MKYLPAKPNGFYTRVVKHPKKPSLANIDSTWFIDFYYYHDGEWKYIRRRGEVNKVHTLTEKIEELEVLAEAFEIEMDNGWNPITGETHDQVSVVTDNISLQEALPFALEKCDISPATHKAYKNCIKYFLKAARQLNYHYFPMRHIKRKFVKAIMEQARISNNWSNIAYNRKLGYLKALFSQLVEWEVIEYNPAYKMKLRKVMETNKFVPYTPDEKKIIADHFLKKHYGAYVYFMTLYHTGMRPVEILALKISDLHINDDIIRIIPEQSRHNSKTRKVREVLINHHLKPLLTDWIKCTCNKEFYVFGSPYEAGKGRKGSSPAYMIHPDYFKPSPTRIKRDTVTRLWKNEVMDKLGIIKYQYAAKHTGTDDRLLSGINIKALQDLYGHTDEFMTKRYQTVLKKLYRQEINEKVQAFV